MKLNNSSILYIYNEYKEDEISLTYDTYNSLFGTECSSYDKSQFKEEYVTLQFNGISQNEIVNKRVKVVGLSGSLHNGISREFIVDTVYNEEPINYEHSGKNQYAVIFPAPSTKNYSEIKVIFACNDNKIDLVTIMPHGKTNRQQNTYKSDSYKKKEKMINKAKSKRDYL